jgi:hypothetical protein
MLHHKKREGAHATRTFQPRIALNIGLHAVTTRYLMAKRIRTGSYLKARSGLSLLHDACTTRPPGSAGRSPVPPRRDPRPGEIKRSTRETVKPSGVAAFPDVRSLS